MNDTLKLEYAEFVAKGTQGKKELCTKPDRDFFSIIIYFIFFLASVWGTLTTDIKFCLAAHFSTGSDFFVIAKLPSQVTGGGDWHLENSY